MVETDYVALKYCRLIEKLSLSSTFETQIACRMWILSGYSSKKWDLKRIYESKHVFIIFVMIQEFVS